MKRILLISIIENVKYSNSGLEYIAYYLREKKWKVDIKYFHNDESKEYILNNISYDYDFYGFSVYSTYYDRVREVSKHIYNNTKSMIFWGGVFPSQNFKDILEEEGSVDYIILGDGEEPIERLLNHHMTNNKILIGDENIASHNDIEEKKQAINGDINRWTSFDYFEYDYYNNNQDKVHCLLTKSNVCTGACTFCCSRKGKIIYKDIERIVNEIKFVATKYKVRNFYFSDDNIFDLDSVETKERLIDLFTKIRNLKMNLTFSAFAKTSSIRTENKDLYELMSKIGFYFIFIGVDAGNEQDRKLYRKLPTLEQNISAIKTLEECGIWPRFGLIGINPYSTLNTLKDNYLYLKKIRSSNFYHYGGLRLQLFKNTSLYQKVKEDGLLQNDYSFINVYGYQYIDIEVEKIVGFIRNYLLPRMDAINIQFTQLKRCYELTRHVNKKANKFQNEIIEFGNREFDIIEEYFYHLYVENDLEYCKIHIEELAQNMECEFERYREIENELQKIYLNTDIFK